ncbi:hypothetical protein [Azospirillum palustre]
MGHRPTGWSSVSHRLNRTLPRRRHSCKHIFSIIAIPFLYGSKETVAMSHGSIKVLT